MIFTFLEKSIECYAEVHGTVTKAFFALLIAIRIVQQVHLITLVFVALVQNDFVTEECSNVFYLVIL